MQFANRNGRKQWFREAAFGMFVHWGVYAIPGKGEWIRHQEAIPSSEYKKLAELFKPQDFDADYLVRAAKNAGMRYIVFTARHHDGFCMFDSKFSEFTSVKSASGRDFISEFVSSCRKYNMGIGIYYSLVNWNHPASFEGPEKNPEGWKEMVEQSHAQIKELCTNYGKIDVLWYDGNFYVNHRRTIVASAEHWQAHKLNAMVRKLQPDILINNRSGLPEDFDTPEQRLTPSETGRLWEACMTMNSHWGYFADDDEWKHPRRIIINLTACAATDGNYLLNVGPDANGSIPEASLNILKKIGEWTRRNGEAVYGGTEIATPFDGGSTGMTMKKNGNYYLFVHFWPKYTREVILPYVPVDIESAFILSTKEPVSVCQDNKKRLILKNLPELPPDPLTTVILLKPKK